MARCRGCSQPITFPHPQHPGWDEGCFEEAQKLGRWVAVFKCKMCGARVELDGAVNGQVSCHLYKTQQTHECYEGLKVGILEQVGAQRVP